MSRFARAPLVAAYVCPRGAFAIVGKRAGSGIQVDRVIEAPGEAQSEVTAATHLITALRDAQIHRATVFVALRGFGVVHHVLQLPPAKDELLAPIIEREVRRLEPELAESVIGWTPLPPLDLGGEALTQRSVLVAAAPSAMVTSFEQTLRGAGYAVAHVTALPVAIQRLVEEFDDAAGTTAVVAPLPDGAFLGFSIGGAIRLVVEPPLPPGVGHDAAALAEELELGAMFVRQQFRGAHVERIAVVGTSEELAEVEGTLGERMHVPAKALGTRSLNPPALAALGAVLDDRSLRPLSLGGDSRKRTSLRAAGGVQAATAAALVILTLLGLWTVTETFRATRAADALRLARTRIQQDSFGLAPVRATADQRRVMRDGILAARVLAMDRIALQQALAGIAASVRRPVSLDTLRLDRGSDAWTTVMTGTVSAPTNGQSIQALHDVFQTLPQRLRVDSLRLDSLGYPDSAGVRHGSSIARFRFAFAIPFPKRQ